MTDENQTAARPSYEPASYGSGKHHWRVVYYPDVTNRWRHQEAGTARYATYEGAKRAADKLNREKDLAR